MRRVFLLAVILVGAISLPSGAAEYRLLKLGGHYVKWGGTALGEPATVSYSFAERRYSFTDAINCGDIGPVTTLLEKQGFRYEDLSREVFEAFQMWSNVANIAFRYVGEPDRADILIGVQSKPSGIAYANVWPKRSDVGRIAEIGKAVICLSPSVRWEMALDGKDDTYSIRHVVAHEIGHTIGLDHPGRLGQLMGFRYTDESDGLRNGDVLGASILYGDPDTKKGN